MRERAIHYLTIGLQEYFIVIKNMRLNIHFETLQLFFAANIFLQN